MGSCGSTNNKVNKVSANGPAAPRKDPIQTSVDIIIHGRFKESKGNFCSFLGKSTYNFSKVMELLKDKIPDYTPELHYEFFCQDILINDQPSSILLKDIIPKADLEEANKEGSQGLQIQVLVSSWGYKIPRDIRSAYQSLEYLARPTRYIENEENSEDPGTLELMIYNRKKHEISYQRISTQGHDFVKYFGFTSAYCNGINDMLFVSGGDALIEVDGTESRDLTTFNTFYAVNLKETNKIVRLPDLHEARYWHSMICVPSEYVFIIGGNTSSVELYNTKANTIEKHSSLTKERAQPSLALINNKSLFAFCGNDLQTRTNLNDFEVFEFDKKVSDWNLFTFNQPKETSFDQNLFGVSIHSTSEFVFLGGIDTCSNSGQHTEKAWIFNTEDYSIKKTDFDNRKIDFSEKFFIPLNETNFCIPCDEDHYDNPEKILGYSKGQLAPIQFQQLNK